MYTPKTTALERRRKYVKHTIIELIQYNLTSGKPKRKEKIENIFCPNSQRLGGVKIFRDSQIRKTARMGRQNFPEKAEIVHKSSYVDDITSSIKRASESPPTSINCWN